MACTCVVEINAWPSRRNSTPLLSQECQGCGTEDWVLLQKIAERILAGEVYLHLHGESHTWSAPRYAMLTFELHRSPTRLTATIIDNKSRRGEIDYVSVMGSDAAVVYGNWVYLASLLHDVALYMLLGDDAVCSGLTHVVVPTSGWTRTHCTQLTP